MKEPAVVGLETECGEAAKATAVSSCEEPLEESPQKAPNKGFEKNPHLFPALASSIKLNNNPIYINTSVLKAQNTLS